MSLKDRILITILLISKLILIANLLIRVENLENRTYTKENICSTVMSHCTIDGEYQE